MQKHKFSTVLNLQMAVKEWNNNKKNFRIYYLKALQARLYSEWNSWQYC